MGGFYQHSIAYYIILKTPLHMYHIPANLRRYYVGVNKQVTFNEVGLVKNGYCGFCVVKLHTADKRLGLSEYFKNNKNSWFDGTSRIHRPLDKKLTRDIYLTPQEEALRRSILENNNVKHNILYDCWFEIAQAF